LLPIALLLLALSSVQVATVPDQSHSQPFAPPCREEGVLRDRLRGHVWTLAAEIGERNLWRPHALHASARYIEERLRGWGYDVGSQDLIVAGHAVRNIEAELPGYRLPDEIVLLGAHYDSVAGSPGANDNATGAAALLELARLLAGTRIERTVRFVAFVNEEPPFFQTEAMGSRNYARRARERGEQVVAMLSLETIGYFSDAEGSQWYAFPFNLLSYPRTANFIGFVGNVASRGLVRRSVESFRRHAGFPAESVAAPGWLMGIGWSDHWSFWKEGYPAIMVTDTALFRYRHYHTIADTPDKIDYARMACVTAGIARVVVDLAGSDSGPQPPHGPGRRRW
jgi:hypothetical protein